MIVATCLRKTRKHHQPIHAIKWIYVTVVQIVIVKEGGGGERKKIKHMVEQEGRHIGSLA